MDSKKSNKIREIVRLQQILKKWKKLANAPKNTTSNNNSSNSSCNNINTSSKSIKFLKKTLSFSDSSSSNMAAEVVVPKGFLAVCVGEEQKRFIIPTDYLGHQAFGILLREAEEEYGFQQEGILKIPCQVAVFEKILKVVEEKRSDSMFFSNADTKDFQIGPCYSPDCDPLSHSSHHPQMCR